MDYLYGTNKTLSFLIQYYKLASNMKRCHKKITYSFPLHNLKPCYIYLDTS